MGKDSKNCKQPSHKLLKDQAKNRVEDLQSMINELQAARKESRAVDVASMEDQVNQILCEWKAELDEPTPASSLREDSLGSFSKELGQLLQQFDVEDDATSPLTAPPVTKHGDASGALADSRGNEEVCYSNHTPQQQGFQDFQNHTPQQHEFLGSQSHPLQHEFQSFQSPILQHEFPGFENQTPQHHELSHFKNHTPQPQELSHFENHTPNSQDYQGFVHGNGAIMQGRMMSNFEASGLDNLVANNYNMTQLDLHSEFFINATGIEHWGIDDIPDLSGVLPHVNLPPSAFLGPKCALWDCARPAQASEFCKNYCSGFHAELAVKECPPGTPPILRPGGIGLKDGPLFVALKSKLEGKDVGIPECIGAATAKSPWNTPELFDISILKGEKIREWLFFDKPRRAFETGNRKQRSLPDHEGRGWHESRKQVVKEYGGLKRSYYADPQPQKDLDWHLFEYEIDNCDVYALYRLELKVAGEKKKSPKTKATNDPLVDLQKQMGRLTAEGSAENKRSGKGKAKANETSDQVK